MGVQIVIMGVQIVIDVRYRPPKQCRHTFISQMLTAGVPIDWIVHQVGHTSPEMIRRRYGKWINEDRQDMVRLAEKLLGL
jgi:integrase